MTIDIDEKKKYTTGKRTSSDSATNDDD